MNQSGEKNTELITDYKSAKILSLTHPHPSPPHLTPWCAAVSVIDIMSRAAEAETQSTCKYSPEQNKQCSQHSLLLLHVSLADHYNSKAGVNFPTSRQSHRWSRAATVRNACWHLPTSSKTWRIYDPFMALFSTVFTSQSLKMLFQCWSFSAFWNGENIHKRHKGWQEFLIYSQKKSIITKKITHISHTRV